MQTESSNKFYKIYLGVIVAINIIPILAPVLYALGQSVVLFKNIAKLIYFVYSFACHQLGYRSLILFDYQFAWCSRDTGIWLGILLGAIIAKRPGFTGLKWYWVPPLLLPMVLDGGIQTVATVLGINPNLTGTGSNILYMSNNLTRFLTGGLFGLGLSLFISYWLYQGVNNFAKNKISNRTRELFLASLLAIPIVYVGLIGAWQLTSRNNLPLSFLDAAPKTPAESIFLRREFGPCPTGVEDLVNWDCWWN